jgi:peroxiredoxin
VREVLKLPPEPTAESSGSTKVNLDGADELSTRIPKWLTSKRVETVLLVGLIVFTSWRFFPHFTATVGLGGPVGTAPDVSFTTLEGEQLQLRDLRGQVVLVNFWATWCLPCRLEMPGFEKLYKDRKDDGFVIVGVSTDRTGRDDVEAFLRKYGITYPVALETPELRAAFGGINGIPTSFLIDRSGVIRHRVFGFFAPPSVRLAVGRLLDEASGEVDTIAR